MADTRSLHLSLISRTLPTTWRLLKRYGAVLYEGHNRIDLGSYPNIMALLTGEDTAVGFGFQELKGGRFWVDEQESKLISKVYKEHGYVTFHMEDAAGMATFQVKGKVGFKNPPADFYYRAFHQAISEATDLRCGLIGGWGGVYQYLQEKNLHEYQLDVLHDFIEEYKTIPTFAFLHLAEYTHNDQNLARLYDESLSSMLGMLEDLA